MQNDHTVLKFERGFVQCCDLAPLCLLVHQPPLQKSESIQKQKIFSVENKSSTFTVFELL